MLGIQRRISAWLPIAMSMAALLLSLVRVLTVGPQPDLDEGFYAHLWQLLMVAQIPVAVVYLLKTPRSARRQMVYTVALQAGAALIAVMPVALLRW